MKNLKEKNTSKQLSTDSDLIARHYNPDPKSLKYIQNHQLYRNDPAGLWSDLRIYAQRGLQLKDIVNELKTP